MRELFTSTTELMTRVGERRGRFCRERCQRVVLQERVLLQQLWLGVRV